MLAHAALQEVAGERRFREQGQVGGRIQRFDLGEDVLDPIQTRPQIALGGTELGYGDLDVHGRSALGVSDSRVRNVCPTWAGVNPRAFPPHRPFGMVQPNVTAPRIGASAAPRARELA